MQFEDLERLRRSIVEISEAHEQSLSLYRHGTGFRHLYDEKTRNKTARPSIASSATCLSSLRAAGKWDPSFSSITDSLLRTLISLKFESSGLKEGNAFSTSFMFCACLELASSIPAFDRNAYAGFLGHVKQGIDFLFVAIEDASSKSRSHRPIFLSVHGFPESAYLTKSVLIALSMAAEMGFLDKKQRRKLSDYVTLIRQRSLDEIRYQLALRAAKSRSQDPFQLAYSVILFIRTADSGQLSPSDSDMIDTALDMFFSTQDDGSWPIGRPLFNYPELGNAYCYEFECLAAMLSESGLYERLLRHFDALSKSVDYLRRSAFRLKTGCWAWSSGHHPKLAGPESWSTASVFHFLHALDRLVAEAIRRSVFDYLDTPYTPPTPIKAAPFAEKMWDCPFVLANERASLKDTIFHLFVEPIAQSLPLIERGQSMSEETPMAAIFFGPPGTSKTDLSKHIASYLGWPRLSLDPSHFLRTGIDKLQAEANRVFGMLASIERVVILLDEIDEMVRERNLSPQIESRFLTTAMLPKLLSITKYRRVVFIVATNHIELFDVAIRRPGRFDMLVQIMPPAFDEKMRFTPGLEAALSEKDIAYSDVVKRLDDLTYDEFKSLSRRFRQSGLDSLMTSLDDHWQSYTMQQPLDPSNHESKTWRDKCKDDVAKQRLPGDGIPIGDLSLPKPKQLTLELA